MSGIPPPGLAALTALRIDRHTFSECCYCAVCRRWAGFVALVCLVGCGAATVAALAVFTR